MDIYQQAREMNADYYDFHTGYIYCIQKYNEEVKTNPDAKIEVRDSVTGELLGYARKSKAG